MESELTLSQLIDTLSLASKSEYQRIFERYKTDRQELSKFETWSLDTYLRNGIFKNDDFELILLCWEKGHQTSIHCHNGEECWVYIIDGEIEEEQYSKGQMNALHKTMSKKFSPNDTSYITDAIGLHRLRNSYNGRTMSLHLYAKPILNCSYFDETTRTFIRKQLNYDTFNGEPIELKSHF